MASIDFNFLVNADVKSFEIKTQFATTTYDLGIEFEEFNVRDGEYKYFADFLLKVGMNEIGSYKWYNSDGESGMYYNADKKQLSIEAYQCFQGGFHLTLDLSDENVKRIVISELSKLAKLTIEKLLEHPDIE